MATTQWAYTGGVNTNMTVSSSTPSLAQSIDSPSTGDFELTEIRLYLKRAGDPGIVTVGLYVADANGFPVGSALSTGTFDSLELSDSSPSAWLGGDTPKSILMSSYDVSYSSPGFVIVITSDDYSSVRKVYWHGVSTGSYSFGHASYFFSGAWLDRSPRDMRFEVLGVTAPKPSAPANPSPSDTGTEISITKTPISYDASTPVEADTYEIYFGVQGDVLTKIMDTENLTSWKTPYVILNIEDYNPATASGYRSPKADDVLTNGVDSFTVIHAVVGDLVNVQYEAKLYAFRTAGPGGKVPGDVLTNGVAPDVENPQAVKVTLNDSLFFKGDVEEVYLPQGYVFEWRVDATNEIGTTTGDTWTFTSDIFKPPQSSYVLISGGNGKGPPIDVYDDAGEEGVDWSWTGGNAMLSVRRLVAVAADKLWYEDI